MTIKPIDSQNTDKCKGFGGKKRHEKPRGTDAVCSGSHSHRRFSAVSHFLKVVRNRLNGNYISDSPDLSFGECLNSAEGAAFSSRGRKAVDQNR
jgi:hypothetical protein